MICMFDKDFFNSLWQPLKNNLWPTHPLNQNYKTWLLRQSNYLLGFVYQNKYSFEIVINKKWPKNQSDLKEDQITNTCLLQGGKHNGATNESWHWDFTSNARILEQWQWWNVKSCGRIMQGNGQQISCKHQRLPTILP